MSEKTDKLWKKDDYLKPVDSNDPMLMYDIEEDENQGNLLKGNDKKSDNLHCYPVNYLQVIKGVRKLSHTMMSIH